jgi:hypothetical protein
MTFLDQVYEALRPQKALTVPEIHKALKYERSVKDIGLALRELHKTGRAEFLYLGINQGPFVPAFRRGPRRAKAVTR